MISIKELYTILRKKLIPDPIIFKILKLYFHGEHVIKLSACFKPLLFKAFSRGMYCVANFESAVKCFFECNCCKRHQFNKALITNNDLNIITKSCVFKDWVYDKNQVNCNCHCRHNGREFAREWLKEKNPNNLMIRTLGIKNYGYHNGPDPDEDGYAEYMHIHYAHLGY